MSKTINEPNHVAVDLYKGEARIINGKSHATKRTSEVRVIDPRGYGVCEMIGTNQEALDTAWRIAAFLDSLELRISQTGQTLSPTLGTL